MNAERAARGSPSSVSLSSSADPNTRGSVSVQPSATREWDMFGSPVAHVAALLALKRGEVVCLDPIVSSLIGSLLSSVSLVTEMLTETR